MIEQITKLFENFIKNKIKLINFNNKKKQKNLLYYNNIK